MKGHLLALRACPRVAPLGWPHAVSVNTVLYKWVYVKPDGSGWTVAYDASLLFQEDKLDDVLEGFYNSAGPYPYDFEVTLHSVKAKKTKKATKAKKAKKVRRSKG